MTHTTNNNKHRHAGCRECSSSQFIIALRSAFFTYTNLHGLYNINMLTYMYVYADWEQLDKVYSLHVSFCRGFRTPFRVGRGPDKKGCGIVATNTLCTEEMHSQPAGVYEYPSLRTHVILFENGADGFQMLGELPAILCFETLKCNRSCIMWTLQMTSIDKNGYLQTLLTTWNCAIFPFYMENWSSILMAEIQLE